MSGGNTTMQDTTKYDLIKFEDGEFSLDVNVSPKEDTVWLSRLEIAKLFDRDVKIIGKHINNALNEEAENATVANFETVQMEGNRKVKRFILKCFLHLLINLILHFINPLFFHMLHLHHFYDIYHAIKFQ